MQPAPKARRSNASSSTRLRTWSAWRKVEIRNGAVGVIEADQPEHWFDQPFFFAVNTMVGKAD